MGALFNMFTRIGMWTLFGGFGFYFVTVVYMYFFKGGGLVDGFNADEAIRSAVIGAGIGFVVGFVKKG